MRILSYLFSLFFIFLLGVVVVFYVGREALLWWTVYTFKNSIKSVQIAAQGTYDAQCNQRLGTGGLSATLQIRFLSSREYVLEAACDQFANAPILIETGELGMFMSKRPGSSGIIVGAESSFVELVAFEKEAQVIKKILPIPLFFIERSRVVGIENMRIVSRALAPGEHLQQGPVTSCEGYGYQCCSLASEKGVGEQITGLSDCKESCFSSCVNRPVVLSFNTNPVLDMRTRQVMISSGGGVEFSYVSDGDATDSIQAILDFGDSTQPGAINGEDGTLSHVYTCMSSPCTYTAKLKLIDKWNIESAPSTVSTVTVIVQ